MLLTFDYGKGNSAAGEFSASDVSVKVSGAASAAKIQTVTEGDEEINAYILTVKKAGTVTVKAKPNDGSSKKYQTVATFKVDYVTLPGSDDNAKHLVAAFVAADGGTNEVLVDDGEDKEFANPYGNGRTVTLNVFGTVADPAMANSLMNLKSVKVKSGGKIKKAKAPYGIWSSYTITPTASETVVEITEKTSGKAVAFTIKTDAIQDTTTKAKVKASNKWANDYTTADKKGTILSNLFFNSDFYGAGPGVPNAVAAPNLVTYTLNSTNAASAKYVDISITKGDAAGWIRGALVSNVADQGGEVLGGGTIYRLPVNNGAFVIDWSVVENMNQEPGGDREDYNIFDIKPGTYKLSATLMSVKEQSVAKTFNINVKAKKAPKANIKPVKKTLKLSSGPATIDWSKSKNVAAVAVGDPGLLNNNNKGVINKFRQAYVLKATTDQFHSVQVTTNSASDYAPTKDDKTGWLAVRYMQVNGIMGTAYVKLTVK
jgi:hypothetical protein